MVRLFLSLLIVISLAGPCLGELSGATVFEVRTTGDDTNGGGYSAGGTDYSQQDAAQLTVTDAACSGNTTLTSATGGFTAAMIGNVVYLSSGPGWYQITAHTDTNTVTLDRAGPNASGMTCKVGGALASPGGLGRVWNNAGVAGLWAYIKSGTYTLTTATVNTPGGPFLAAGGQADKRFVIKGYDSTRDDLGTRPLVDAGAITNVTIFAGNGADGNNQLFVNLAVDGNDNATTTGFSGADTQAVACEAADCTTGWSLTNLGCKAYSCANGFGAVPSSFSWADACNNGWNGGADCVGCVATNCTNDGWSAAYRGSFILCVAWNCGGDGFDAHGSLGSEQYSLCVATGCGGYGWNSADEAMLFRCADYDNLGRTNATPLADIEPISLTGDPFADPANGDFRLNATAGAGAELRAAGYGIGTVMGQTETLDISPSQRNAASGGGTIVIDPNQ